MRAEDSGDWSPWGLLDQDPDGTLGGVNGKS